MAKVWLDRDECTRDGGLPDVCIVCGDVARESTRQTFRWCPEWVIVLILAGVLVWVIVAMILTKTMVVYAPVCEAHRGHWFKRTLLNWLLVLGGIAAIVLGFVALAVMENDPNLRDLAFLGPLLGVLTFIGTLIAAVIVSRTAIRPTEITDDDIQLTGVNEEFVEALKEQRRAERAEREKRRGRRYADS
jgi:hypothetical protein